MTSCACFWSVWVKTHFPLKGPSLFIFAKLSFRSGPEVLLSWITENKDVSSENSLAFEDNPFDKFLYILKTIMDQVSSPGEHLL